MDYAVYVRRVEELLRRRLVGALRMGGLYWRLALYYSKESVNIDKYMAMISEDAEPLTKSEQDVLIGKYYVKTSEYNL